MKTYKPSAFLILLCFSAVLLASCGHLKELEKAWGICESANGTPTGNPITGPIFDVDSINGGSPGDRFTSREYKPGVYGYTYLTEEYENLAGKLDEASAILCSEVTTKFFSRCNYPSDEKINFTLNLYHTEARLKLVAWPSGEVIAQTTLSNHYEKRTCPLNILHESDEKSRDENAPINLKEWLDQYVTISK